MDEQMVWDQILLLSFIGCMCGGFMFIIFGSRLLDEKDSKLTAALNDLGDLQGFAIGGLGGLSLILGAALPAISGMFFGIVPCMVSVVLVVPLSLVLTTCALRLIIAVSSSVRQLMEAIVRLMSWLLN